VLPDPEELAAAVDAEAAASRSSGVVRVDLDGEVLLERAYGLAHRGLGLPNTPATRLGVASVVKGLTALTVVSLAVDGVLPLATRARDLLGGDLPLVHDAVTVEHLLAHRSGIGDYLDEDAVGEVTDHVLAVPVHRLATTEDHLQVLDGHPQVAPPGERFAYNNGGYVLLALLAERAAGRPFPDLVHERVCAPAGMTATSFPRSDEPEAGLALGYLHAEGLRTNVLHLPVRGSGDGGACSTAADLSALWTALEAGRVVPPPQVAEVLRPRSDVPGEHARYGLGFWLHPTGRTAWLEGYDAGVSARTVRDPDRRLTCTVLCNWSDGAWPVARLLRERLTP
jgi:CubicO group peptidase (beta-lactamase class C family)